MFDDRISELSDIFLLRMLIVSIIVIVELFLDRLQIESARQPGFVRSLVIGFLLLLLLLADIRFHNSMEDRLGSACSSLSLNVGDQRAGYYPLSQHDNTNRTSTGNAISAVANSTVPSVTTAHTLCMLVNARRVQQRYKLLVDGLVQVCRVPHAKNIIEKIRFSRFLRRWEEHHIQLEQNEISSETVRRRLDER